MQKYTSRGNLRTYKRGAATCVCVCVCVCLCFFIDRGYRSSLFLKEGMEVGASIVFRNGVELSFRFSLRKLRIVFMHTYFNHYGHVAEFSNGRGQDKCN